MTLPDPTKANIAFAKALGLDPTRIAKDGLRVTCDSHQGPIVEVTYLVTRDGETVPGYFELKQFKLVPITGEDVSPAG